MGDKARTGMRLRRVLGGGGDVLEEVEAVVGVEAAGVIVAGVAVVMTDSK